jgi:hypothetical protein
LQPVDPAGEEEDDEGKRRRQRVRGARVPERLAPCKTCQIRARAPLGWGRVPRPQASGDCVEIRRLSNDPVSAEFSHRTPGSRRLVRAVHSAALRAPPRKLRPPQQPFLRG